MAIFMDDDADVGIFGDMGVISRCRYRPGIVRGILTLDDTAIVPVAITIVVAIHVPGVGPELVIAIFATTGGVINASMDDHEMVDDLIAISVILRPIEIGIDDI